MSTKPPVTTRSPAPHVSRAIGLGLQAKNSGSGKPEMAPHVRQAISAVQAKPAPGPRQTVQAKPAPAQRLPLPHRPPRSIQPCSAFLNYITCGLLGSPATQNDDQGSGRALLELDPPRYQTSTVTVTKKKPVMIALDQGDSGLVTYGGAVQNSSTTTCGLVVVLVEGAQAVAYHWPFCQESSTYVEQFRKAVGDREGESIEVVVNGGRYRKGDPSPGRFRDYLRRTFKLPVTVYRQVVDDNEAESDIDPTVEVHRDGVRAFLPGYQLVGI